MEKILTPPSERIEKIVEEIKKRTAQNCYALTIVPERKPTIFDSKFGGVPYWDLQKPYPTDPDGEKMLFLAQINFDTEDVDAPLPQKGMLQFFIVDDDVFGLDFDRPDQQNTFRVIYHEQIDRSVTSDAVRALEIPEESENTPVCREVLVAAAKQIGYLNSGTYEFDGLFRTVMQEVFGEDIGEQDYDDILTEEEESYLSDMLEETITGHRMLGYPFFTQSDPREDGDYAEYDTLLFQMDSEMGDDHEDYVLWGDCGVGNFFIARRDLEQCDFSRVLYNWDCY